MSKNYIYQLNGINKRSDYFIRKIASNHRLICRICMEILIDPYQTQCGCRFCYKCISDHFDSNSKLCPECNVAILVDIIKDRAVEREILSLEISCINNGCNNICEFKNLSNHLEICEWRQETCNKCKQSFPYHLKSEHSESLCLSNICKCDYCNQEMTRMHYEAVHINPSIEDTSRLCDNFIGECPYKCDIEICDNIKNHLVNNCPNKLNKCELSNFGCEFVGNRDDLIIHMEQSYANHLLITLSEIGKLKAESSVFNEYMKLNESNTKTIESLKEENRKLKDQLSNLEKNFNENRNEIEGIKSEIVNYKNWIGIEKEDVDDSDLSLNYGVCTWTIRNIQEKINDAKSGGNLQITSNPFYLTKPGYRFSLKIYPNGDGPGKGQFLSIYFLICKGEFDDQLDWPFQHRVSLSLVSNDRSVPDISINMKPDNNISCYSQPINGFNLGAGQPEFVHLSKLSNTDAFVRDGSIKIRFAMKIERNSSLNNDIALQASRKIK